MSSDFKREAALEDLFFLMVSVFDPYKVSLVACGWKGIGYDRTNNQYDKPWVEDGWAGVPIG